jgi:glycosyltransferase involved in cell wall biosynthesis
VMGVDALKILILNWRDINHPQAGGAERYVHEIGRRLALKHEVTFLCGSYPGASAEELIDGMRILRRGGQYTIYIHAAMHLMSVRSYDLIIDDINGIPFFSPLLTRTSVIAIIHHVVGKEIFRKELPFPLSGVGYLAERSIPRVYNKCQTVTVSESSKEELREIGLDETRMMVIHNGVDVDRQMELSPKSSTPLVAYFGRIKGYKRVDHVVRAFVKVRERLPLARLVIAGRGEQEELKKLAAELNIAPSVDFQGEVDEMEKRLLLSSSWVFVTASMKEGWGLAVIEANACGTPAIAYDVPGLRDSIVNGQNGQLVPDGDVDGLAGAISALLQDEDKRKSMSVKALEWADRFSWDNSASAFETLIAKVKPQSPK